MTDHKEAVKSERLVIRQDIEGICTLKLNRPKARNALSSDMMAELNQNFKQIASDKSVRVVIIEGSGPAFCSGHDLKELKANNSPDFAEKIFKKCSKIMMQILNLPQPVIAKIHGIATAAGCQLVATSDLAIASDSATFATPGVNIGLFCTTPSVAISRVVSRKKSLEMLFTGDSISAGLAKEIGLINYHVPDEELDKATNSLAKTISMKSSRVLQIGKQAFYKQLEKPITESYQFASSIMTQNMLEKDCVEGISAFVEKRSPKWSK